jgi:hypothetical protein
MLKQVGGFFMDQVVWHGGDYNLMSRSADE